VQATPIIRSEAQCAATKASSATQHACRAPRIAQPRYNKLILNENSMSCAHAGVPLDGGGTTNRLSDAVERNCRGGGETKLREPDEIRLPHSFIDYFFFAAFFLAFFFAAIIVSFKVNLGIVHVRFAVRTPTRDFSNDLRLCCIVLRKKFAKTARGAPILCHS
jgi:hypothetical protein